jgi:enamine deaminase RidA (YjgF/YER057c/UK114 family)
MQRLNITSGSPFEPKIGFSRAVRVGSIIAVSGTAPIGADGKTAGVGDPAAQTRRCLEIIAAALEKAGASMKDVIRTRTFLTRIEDWEESGRAHGEFFGNIRPASTMVQVSRFINPEWLVEIEADAVVQEPESSTVDRLSDPNANVENR